MNTLILSTNGDDQNPGTLSQPLATLHRALELAAQSRDDDTAILFREGTYVLDRTAVIDKGCEPMPGKTLRIAAYEEESVMLSGGAPLSNWTPVPGREGVWQTELPALPDGKSCVHALYDEDGLLPRSSSHASIKDGYQTTNERCGRFPTDFCTTKEARTTLHFPEGSLQNWDNLEDIEIYMSPQRPWLVNYLRIASLDMHAGIARLSPQATYEAIGKFVIQNHLDLISEPGEWAIDTRKNLIYLKPKGEEPGDGILLPRLDEVIRIEGRNDLEGEDDDPIRGIHVENLSLAHGDRAVWTPEDKGLQHDWSMWDKGAALVRFRGAQDCSLKHCTLHDTGSDAVRLDLYCQEIAVCHNHMYQTGGVGVLLAGYGPGYKDVNRGNLILDNHIHHTGTLYPHSMGIFVWQSGHNRIAHNHVCDLGYIGIVLSGVRRRFWDPEMRPRDIREHIPLIDFEVTAALEGGTGSWDPYRPYMHCGHNVVEYNEIHDCMRLLNDGNAIYLSATGPDNIIRANLVYNHPKGNNALLRTDDDQFDSVWEKNIVIGNPGHDVGLVHKGQNAFNQNVLLNSRMKVYTGVHGPSEGINSMRGNVFLYDGEIAEPQLVDTSGFAEGKVDHNLFWCANPEQAETFLRDRQAMNSDANSMVADPCFEDVGQLVFKLKDGSPLPSLGIELAEVETIGLLSQPALERLRKENALSVRDGKGV